MGASLTAHGFAELTDKLLKLKGVGSKKVLDQAGRKGMAPTLEAAKANVPVSSEGGPHLRDALAVSTVKPSGGNVVSTTVLRVKKVPARVRKFLKAMRKKGYRLSYATPRRYWHLVEFGTSRSAAHPYIRPAASSTAQRSVDEVANTLRKKVEQAARGQNPESA